MLSSQLLPQTDPQFGSRCLSLKKPQARGSPAPTPQRAGASPNHPCRAAQPGRGPQRPQGSSQCPFPPPLSFPMPDPASPPPTPPFVFPHPHLLPSIHPSCQHHPVHPEQGRTQNHPLPPQMRTGGRQERAKPRPPILIYTTRGWLCLPLTP